MRASGAGVLVAEARESIVLVRVCAWLIRGGELKAGGRLEAAGDKAAIAASVTTSSTPGHIC